jgi:hypothetical protein
MDLRGRDLNPRPLGYEPTICETVSNISAYFEISSACQPHRASENVPAVVVKTTTRASPPLDNHDGLCYHYCVVDYTLRNVDEVLWKKVKVKAAQQGKPIRTVILELLEKYAG